MTKARILADYVAGGTTASEFDFLDGVTSNVQTQMDLKAPITNAALVTPNLGTPSAGVVTNLSGVLPVGVTGGSGLTALGTVASGTLGSGVTFPAGHVLQVTSAICTTPSSTSTLSSITPSSQVHSITTTSGNDVYVMMNIRYRMYANATAYATHQFWIYHSTNGSTYTDLSGILSSSYYEESGNIPGSFYDDTVETINYLHEGASGTSHYYKLYYRLNVGTSFEISFDNSQGVTTLMEIQA